MVCLEYTTMAGDTFDIIALDYYNSEHMAHVIADVNPEHAGTIVFDAGVKLNIPKVDYVEISNYDAIPPWRR